MTSSKTPSTPQLTTAVLATLALLSAAGPFAIDLYLPTLPSIARDLNASDALVQFTLTGFMLGMAFGQLIIGPLADRIGRRGLILGGAVVFALASFVCAVAPSIHVLIAARIALGLGGGACVVVSRAVVADLAHGKAAAKAFALMMMIQGLAPVIAPLAGGLLAEPIGWRGLFGVLAGLGVIQLVIAFFLVKESLPTDKRIDEPLGHTVASMLRLLKLPVFTGYTIAFAFGMGAMFSYISASPFVFQNMLGLSPLMFSVVFAVNSLGIVVGSAVSAKLVGRADPHVLLRNAGVVMVLAAAVATADAATGPHLFVLPFALLVMVSCLGFVLGNATALGTAAAGPRAGSAAAVMGCVQFIISGVVSPLSVIAENQALSMGICALVCAAIGVGGTVLAGRARLRAATE
ncbi:Bcr/CflA family drug resistance efflux transporter [Corynebacterium sp. 13CS0277]|nr:Bcr/CflA family drug resistance efflux transporter [Corynebacterium sp. 13CS0277]